MNFLRFMIGDCLLIEIKQEESRVALNEFD